MMHPRILLARGSIWAGAHYLGVLPHPYFLGGNHYKSNSGSYVGRRRCSSEPGIVDASPPPGLVVITVTPGLDNLVAVSISHRWAPLEVIGALEQRALDAYPVLGKASRELVVLATCNRFEAYALADDPGAFLAHARSFLGSAWSYVRVLRGVNAVRHLFRVAAGLESAIIGENEILGQVSRAYEEARRLGYVSKYLSMLFQFAVRVGKLVRSETSISRGNVGFPGAAVKLAWERLGDVDESKIVVVGAGDAGSIIASLARERWPRARLVIVNRSYERAAELAARVGAEAYSLSGLREAIKGARLVFVAINSLKPVVTRDVLSLLEPGALVIDISVPPAVERPVPSHIEYAGLEEVKTAIRDTLEKRLAEVPKAEKIIEDELSVFLAKWEKRMADDAVAKIMRYAEMVASEELEELTSVLRGRGIDGVVAEPLALFAKSLVKKLMRPLILYAQEQARSGNLDEVEKLAEIFEKELEKKIKRQAMRAKPRCN